MARTRWGWDDWLVVLAGLGVFAGFDLIGHFHTPHFWLKLLIVIAFSTVCLFATRERQSVDTFFTVVAAIFAMFAVAMTFGNLSAPHWWLFFVSFSAAAALFVLLSRDKRQTLLGISAIVGFRLLIAGVVYAMRR
jgi:succinate-acetate transporter protein